MDHHLTLDSAAGDVLFEALVVRTPAHKPQQHIPPAIQQVLHRRDQNMLRLGSGEPADTDDFER